MKNGKGDLIYSIISDTLKQYDGEVLLEVLERLVLQNNLPLSYLYDTLMSLVNEEKIMLCFEARCPMCNEVLGMYSSINEIPEQLSCLHCGRKFVKSWDLRYSLRIIVKERVNK